MKRIASLALAALLFTQVAYADVLSPVGPIIIDNDPGGSVFQEIKWFERIRESGIPVRIRGICISACTLVLMLPKAQVCVEPSVSLGFHLASVSDEPDPLLTAVLNRRYYPQLVQDWIKEHGPLTVKPMFM